MSKTTAVLAILTAVTVGMTGCSIDPPASSPSTPTTVADLPTQEPEPAETHGSDEPQAPSYTNPPGAIPQERAPSEWWGDTPVEGPPADVRGLELGCYSLNYGNYLYQGELEFDSAGSYTWLGEPGGSMRPTGRGAEIVFTGGWSSAVGAISILSDGAPEIIVAWEYDSSGHLYWYCS